MTTHLFISNVWYLQMCDHTHDGDTLTHTVNDTRVQQHTHSMTHTFNDTHIQWHLQRHTQWTTHTFNGTHSQRHTQSTTHIQRHKNSTAHTFTHFNKTHIQQHTHATYAQGPLGPSVSESSASLGFALGGRSDASVIPPPLPHKHIRVPHPPTTTCIFLPLCISPSLSHTLVFSLSRTHETKEKKKGKEKLQLGLHTDAFERHLHALTCNNIPSFQCLSFQHLIPMSLISMSLIPTSPHSNISSFQCLSFHTRSHRRQASISLSPLIIARCLSLAQTLSLPRTHDT